MTFFSVGRQEEHPVCKNIAVKCMKHKIASEKHVNRKQTIVGTYPRKSWI